MQDHPQEEALPGGFINTVTRIGDTVRRGPAPRYVHRLLEHLADWPGAPRCLGVDEQGRDIMQHLDGFVPWQDPTSPGVRTPAAIAEAARLLRNFHDLTAGTALADDRQVVCHNDLSPKNTVYRDLGGGLLPVAFIDWDIAAPGERIHDIAHLCWQYVGLGEVVDDDWPELLRAACDGYGDFDRSRLVETVLWWQHRCWRGIESAAEAGDAAMIHLRDQGIPAQIRAAESWVREHRSDLDAALAS